MQSQHKDIKKKLEERVPVKWRFGFTKMKGTKRPEGTIEEGTVFCANKDLLKAVLPLLREIRKEAGFGLTKVQEYLDFIEELVEEKTK